MCLRSQKKLSRALVETRITYEGPMDGIFSLHVQGFTFPVFSSHKENKKKIKFGVRGGEVLKPPPSHPARR